MIDAFIPLKGHSQRVPGKNLRPFGGRPLFHVIVDALQQAETIDRVIIDTDSDDIAASAEPLGVTVVRRDPALLGDDVSVNLLIESCFDRFGMDDLLQTHSTNPLLRPATIDAAVRLFFDHPEATSLFTVTRFQARFYDEQMRAVNHNPDELLPTQQLPPLFLENSNLYICSREGFDERRTRITSHSIRFEMNPLEAVDIDNEEDFVIAQALAPHV